MTTTIQNPVLKENQINLLNNNESIIEINFLSIDVKKKHAIVSINASNPKFKKDVYLEVECYINPNLWNWLTLKKNIVVNTETKETVFQTGYQRFCDKNNLEYLKLTERTFISKNNSNNYFENPFTITANKNGIWSIRLVNQTPKEKFSRVDPNTQQEVTFYKAKINKDGNIMFLAPKFWKRIHIF